MWRNGSITIEGTTYISDNDGVVTELSSNGWTKAGDYWYYVESGEMVRDQVKKIGNKWYGFDSSGRMYNNTESFSFRYDYYTDEWVYYRAKKGGALYENEWYYDEYDNQTWYYGENGRAAKDVQTIDGTKYMFFIMDSYGRTEASQWEGGYMYPTKMV